MTYAQRKKAKYKLKKMGKWNAGTSGAGVNGSASSSSTSATASEPAKSATQSEQQDVEMKDAKEESVPPADAPQLHSHGQPKEADKPFDPKFLERKTGARDQDLTGSLPNISAGGSVNPSANVSRAGSSENLEGVT